MKKNNHVMRVLLTLIIILTIPCWTHASSNIDLNLIFSKHDISPMGFYIGDVNNDGLNELAISDLISNKVEIYKFSNGTLSLLGEIQFEKSPRSVLIADPDKDGKKEVLIGTGREGGFVYVYEFVNGHFYLEWQSPSIDSIHWPTELAVGDIDGDGINEIIIGVTWWGRYLVSYEYNGSGYTEIFRDNIGSDVDSVCVSDINNDGREDLVVGTCCWSDYAVRVYDNYLLSDSVTSAMTSVSVLDVDNDGIEEIIAGVGTQCGLYASSPRPVVKVYKFNGSLEQIFVSNELTSNNEVKVWVSSGKLNSKNYFVSGTYNWRTCGDSSNYIRLFSTTFDEVWSYELNDIEEDVWHLQFTDIDNDNQNELVVTTSKRLLVFSIGPCEGDFDKDGDVDGSDLAVFAADFGRTDCPPCQ